MESWKIQTEWTIKQKRDVAVNSELNSKWTSHYGKWHLVAIVNCQLVHHVGVFSSFARWRWRTQHQRCSLWVAKKSPMGQNKISSMSDRLRSGYEGLEINSSHGRWPPSYTYLNGSLPWSKGWPRGLSIRSLCRSLAYGSNLARVWVGGCKYEQCYISH